MFNANSTVPMPAAGQAERYSLASARFAQRLRAVLDDEPGGATRIRIARGAHVFNTGDHDDDLYLIESGQVKTVVYSRDGKQCLLSIYAVGDVFGELAQPASGRSETATAMRATVLRRIPLARLRAALADQDLREAFIAYLDLRLSEQRQTITNLVTMDSERRLAATLLTLADKIGKPQSGGVRIEQRITQEELSGMVGTTRSRVGFFLKRFNEAGMVSRLPGAFLLVNENRLSDYLETSGV